MIRYIEHVPSAKKFNYLTDSVGWGTRKNLIIEEALKNTLYSLCVYDDDKLIGYGRIIGDKTIFLYIQDVMVIPEYQNKHIGTGIMKTLLKKINEYKKQKYKLGIFVAGQENYPEVLKKIVTKQVELSNNVC